VEAGADGHFEKLGKFLMVLAKAKSYKGEG